MNCKGFFPCYMISLPFIMLMLYIRPNEFEDENKKPSNHWLTSAKNGEESMNFEGAYNKSLSGSGVIIGISDSYIDFHHHDIKNSIDQSQTKEFDDKKMEKNVGLISHGTHVASIISGPHDSYVCSPGLAWGVTLELIRTPFGNHDPFNFESIISHDIKDIDIYVFAWGTIDNGQTLGKLEINEENELKRGATIGRDGKGSIYIVAAGNGGANFDDCNCDSFPSSIYTISVGMLGFDFSRSSFQENCTAMLTSVPDIYYRYSVADYIDRGQFNQIYSTDNEDDDEGNTSCTNEFTGTSAAVPILASAIALAIESRPELSNRDIQHLIVNASKIHPKMKNHHKIKKNAAGHEFNEFIGFGMLDVGLMCQMAQEWSLTTPQVKECSINISKSHFFGPWLLITVFDSSNCEITKTENVILTFSANLANNRASLGIKLISPHLTQSNLLRPRKFDTDYRHFTKRPLKSVHFWDEDPKGIWFAIWQDKEKGPLGDDFITNNEYPKFIKLIERDVKFQIFGT